jgi:hypothetical protein
MRLPPVADFELTVAFGCHYADASSFQTLEVFGTPFL